jgi:hypothetical protein
MDLEFTAALGLTLRSSEILTLLVCQQLEKRHCYLLDIATASGQSDVSARRAMRLLQRHRHLIYTVHNRGSDDPNYEVLWVRRSMIEKAPDSIGLIRRAKIIYIDHPEHGKKSIAHGQIRKFVEKNDLNYRAFRAVLSGDRNHHHGWRLAN